MITTTQACEILSTIRAAHKKRFQLVDFEVNEYGLCVQYRTTLKYPQRVGSWFARFGLEAAATMLENDGVFTLWFRQEAE